MYWCDFLINVHLFLCFFELRFKINRNLRYFDINPQELKLEDNNFAHKLITRIFILVERFELFCGIY